MMDFSFLHFLLQIENLKEPLAMQMGAVTFAGVVGYSAGFAVKKAFKILLILTGVLVVIFQLLANYELLVVNWMKIENLANGFGMDDASTYFAILTSHLPVSGGFVTGFILGFKKG